MDTENDKSNSSKGSSGPKKIILRPRRVDYPRRDREHQEEYAAEVNPIPFQIHDTSTTTSTTNKIRESEEVGQGSRVMGYTGLAFGIASLFLWSIILGPVAAVIGYYAYVKEQKTLGAWAMGLGIVATLSYFVMIPFAR